MNPHPKVKQHNQYAPYWALLMIVLAIAGISAAWIRGGVFWNGYVLDMTGPAWNYILFRGLFTQYSDNLWRKVFTPTRTYVLFILICYTIELAQYLQWYDAVFDPWDLVAYPSLLTLLYVIDYRQQR